MVVFPQSAQYRGFILSDHGKTDVCDPRVACRIYEDVRLVGCQLCGEIKPEAATHPIEISMNYIAGMQVV